MELEFAPMTLADAAAIARWRYEPPYDCYDLPEAGLEGWLAAALDRANGYQAARAGDDLVGFCCFGPDARVPGGQYGGHGVLDVGLGLRPDLTGRGHGRGFVGAVLALAERELAPSTFRLTVAAFNLRAIRVYEALGFRPIGRFSGREAGGVEEWVQMARPAGAAMSP
jgi:ribosomal-protein-alanine N-acetyltransferase